MARDNPGVGTQLPVPDFQLERWRDLLPAYAGYILALAFFPVRAPSWATSGLLAGLNPQWPGVGLRLIRLSLALLAISWLLGTVRGWVAGGIAGETSGKAGEARKARKAEKSGMAYFWRHTRYFPRVWALSLGMAGVVYLLAIAMATVLAPQDIRVILQDFIRGRAVKWWLPGTVFVSAAMAILPVFTGTVASCVLWDLGLRESLRKAGHYLFKRAGFVVTLWSFFVYLIAFAITLVFLLGAVTVSLIRTFPAVAPLAKFFLYVGGEVTWLLAITWFFRDLMEHLLASQKMPEPPDSI